MTRVFTSTCGQLLNRSPGLNRDAEALVEKKVKG